MLGNSLSEAGVTKLVSQMSAASVVYLGNEVSISMSRVVLSEPTNFCGRRSHACVKWTGPW